MSTRGDYACRALLSLALREGETGPTSVRDIAERTALPQPYLEQILLALKGAGLVRSKRGVGGGYVLARPPDEILLSEIVSAVDGPITLGDFGEPHADGACDHEGQCVLLAIWKQAGEVMRNPPRGFHPGVDRQRRPRRRPLAAVPSRTPSVARNRAGFLRYVGTGYRVGAARALEIGCQFAPERHRFAGRRVIQHQFDGVQERALQLQFRAALAVHRVADERMVDRAQVDPDLVGSTGFEIALQQRQLGRAVETIEHLVLGTRRASVWRRSPSAADRCRERPIGASITPCGAAGCPHTNARYARVAWCEANCSISILRACWVRATTSSPELPASSRCTIPGRTCSPTPASSG